ncbi:MAG: hypothetical protein LCH93_03495 [Proteobacteria bacterium]|nr:hypothetical protein [Pseudomonadota bacterium]
MNRRALLVAGLLAAMVLGPAQAASEVKVIYVGGWDCQPCTNWKKQYKAAWLASPEFGKVTWIEVDPPKLKEAYQERHWPSDLKPILDQLPRKNGTPRFLIVQDGKIVSNEFGTNKWTRTMSDLHKILH